MASRIFAGFFSIVAVIVFTTTLVHALWYAPELDAVATSTSGIATNHAGTSTPADYPTRLLIPSLSIDANVQHVGITKKGNMGIPSNFTDVAWYKFGSVPGKDGSAVFAGHVDNAIALPGVFKRLDSIRPGADIYIQTKKGETLHFVVDSLESYAVSDAPAAQIFDTTGASRLALITCGGEWIQKERQYDRRVVVFAHFVNT